MKPTLTFISCLFLFCMCDKNEVAPLSTKANFELTAKQASENAGLFSYYGNTRYDDPTSTVMLTKAVTSDYGGAFYKFKQDVSKGFEVEFDFSITDKGGILDCNSNSGGDGLAFLLLAGDKITVATGGGLGYDTTPNCLAFEIDTWCNAGLNDPNGNHISIHTGKGGANSANESYSIGRASNLPDMSNGSIHTLRILYEAKTISVYLNGARILYSKDGDFDMGKYLTMVDNLVFMGFTSSTGNAYERHNIHRFKLKVL
jgi:hypothetical protein